MVSLDISTINHNYWMMSQMMKISGSHICIYSAELLCCGSLSGGEVVDTQRLQVWNSNFKHMVQM